MLPSAETPSGHFFLQSEVYIRPRGLPLPCLQGGSPNTEFLWVTCSREFIPPLFSLLFPIISSLIVSKSVPNLYASPQTIIQSKVHLLDHNIFHTQTVNLFSSVDIPNLNALVYLRPTPVVSCGFLCAWAMFEVKIRWATRDKNALIAYTTLFCTKKI